jgi:hypothetical protein
MLAQGFITIFVFYVLVELFCKVLTGRFILPQMLRLWRGTEDESPSLAPVPLTLQDVPPGMPISEFVEIRRAELRQAEQELCSLQNLNADTERLVTVEEQIQEAQRRLDEAEELRRQHADGDEEAGGTIEM